MHAACFPAGAGKAGAQAPSLATMSGQDHHSQQFLGPTFALCACTRTEAGPLLVFLMRRWLAAGAAAAAEWDWAANMLKTIHPYGVPAGPRWNAPVVVRIEAPGVKAAHEGKSSCYTHGGAQGPPPSVIVHTARHGTAQPQPGCIRMPPAPLQPAPVPKAPVPLQRKLRCPSDAAAPRPCRSFAPNDPH